MINRLRLLRNVGKFDSVDGAANVPLAPCTLIYGENARGKSTLAAILRSLGSGDPQPVSERRRLGSQHPPHVVFDCAGGGPAVFQDGAWSRVLTHIVVYDDVFIDENVYSGLAVEPDHRQHLHELILGTAGVNLNKTLQRHVDRIEEHNRELRALGETIPVGERGPFTVDDFCSLERRVDIEHAIQTATQDLAAADAQDAVRAAGAFKPLTLPDFNATDLANLLQRDLPALDAAAAERVQEHVRHLGAGGEAWVADGAHRILNAAREDEPAYCPFCAQDLTASELTNHYRAYFSREYARLKQFVSDQIQALERLHGGEAIASFERAVRVWSEQRQFWSTFCDVPEVALNTADIARTWVEAREAVLTALRAKQGTPLERIELSQGLTAALAAFAAGAVQVTTVSARLEEANERVTRVKTTVTAGNSARLRTELARLLAIRARHTPTISAACRAYLDERAAKTTTELRRDVARESLDEYRRTVFPDYEVAINTYLERFNASFRLQGVTSVNTRAGSACSYNIVVNGVSIPVTTTNAAPGATAFRNTLSAGDRNTLAFAFFLARLEQDPQRAQKIVVIDDPVTSLDEHRTLTTIQEIRRLIGRTTQVILLSHSKGFLSRIWEGIRADQCAALELSRAGSGSTIRTWDVAEYCLTEHDRRHAMLREYVVAATPDHRAVASALRPVVEHYLRVAYPEHFPPGFMLGAFHRLCVDFLGTPREILDGADIQVLLNILEYANRFHHDTNRGWQGEQINDRELLGFVQSTLRFSRR